MKRKPYILLFCLALLLAISGSCAAKDNVTIWSEKGNILAGEYFVAKINQKTLQVREWEGRKYLDCEITKNIRGLALGLFPAEETFGRWHMLIDVEHACYFILDYYDRDGNPERGTNDISLASNEDNWQDNQGHFPENAVAWIQKNRPAIIQELAEFNAPVDAERDKFRKPRKKANAANPANGGSSGGRMINGYPEATRIENVLHQQG